jgi:hypothetical protein
LNLLESYPRSDLQAAHFLFFTDEEIDRHESRSILTKIFQDGAKLDGTAANQQTSIKHKQQADKSQQLFSADDEKLQQISAINSL